MKKETNIPEIKPNEIQTSSDKNLGFNYFLSLFIFLATMLSVLFARMEMKRKSYEIYKLTSEFSLHDEEYRSLYIDYSRKVSDREISGLAINTLTINNPKVGKVINFGSTSFMVKR